MYLLKPIKQKHIVAYLNISLKAIRIGKNFRHVNPGKYLTLQTRPPRAVQTPSKTGHPRHSLWLVAAPRPLWTLWMSDIVFVGFYRGIIRNQGFLGGFCPSVVHVCSRSAGYQSWVPLKYVKEERKSARATRVKSVISKPLGQPNTGTFQRSGSTFAEPWICVSLIASLPPRSSPKHPSRRVSPFRTPGRVCGRKGPSKEMPLY